MIMKAVTSTMSVGSNLRLGISKAFRVKRKSGDREKKLNEAGTSVEFAFQIVAKLGIKKQFQIFRIR